MHTQNCPTVCNPMDCSPPGSSVQGILQARILEWDAISFSRGISPKSMQIHVWFGTYQKIRSLAVCLKNAGVPAESKEDSKGRHLNISEILYFIRKIFEASMWFISTFAYFERYLCGCYKTFCSVLCVCFIKKIYYSKWAVWFLLKSCCILIGFPFVNIWPKQLS